MDDTGEPRRSGNQGDKHTCLKMELRVETLEVIRDPAVKHKHNTNREWNYQQNQKHNKTQNKAQTWHVVV